jgi:hypothetical protein
MLNKLLSLLFLKLLVKCPFLLHKKFIKSYKELLPPPLRTVTCVKSVRRLLNGEYVSMFVIDGDNNILYISL